MAPDIHSTRRDFLKTGALAGLGAALVPATGVLGDVRQTSKTSFAGPLAISSRNGQQTVLKALEMIQSGADALDAVVAGVNIVEEDPNDSSVGYGGLPNADGVVQLDSCLMHGPTGRAGGVGCLEGIKNPSKVSY